MKIRNKKDIINYLIIAYIFVLLFNVLFETIKEMYLYHEYLKIEPTRPQFQTDFLKESIKMIWRGIQSSILNLQNFITGLILGYSKKQDKKTKEVNQ